MTYVHVAVASQRSHLPGQQARYGPLRSVRGLVDTASPLGARWISDEACDDPFAAEVMRAQRCLLKRVAVEWPGDSVKEERVLAGRGGSPSLVWHAQAVGALLELGFLPTAQCVKEHLSLLERRLAPKYALNPDGMPQRHPWLLRTRHVAWVLACLAEMPLLETNEETLTGREIADELAHHQRVVGTAARYLLGLDGEGPAAWVSRDGDDNPWTEVWGGTRQPNVLNTVYAAIGVCRAERHGFLEGLTHHRGVAQSTALFDQLLVEKIVVEPRLSGPVVHWNLDWNEKWAREGARPRDLPDGIVGLLTIALVEYANLLREISEPGTESELRARAAQTLARRLAHVLIYRATDGRKKSGHQPHWTSSADAFYSEGAEGEWYVPSYSVCVRAILETDVVPAHHPVIRKAFKTIESLAVAVNEGGDITWIDPTRHPDVARQASAGFRQHAKVDCSPARKQGDNDGKSIGRNASGLHAAVMAYAALRRAFAREDPRALNDRPAIDARRRPESPFRRFEIWRAGGAHYEARAITEGIDVHRYEERTTLTEQAVLLLRVLSEAAAPMSKAELGSAIDAEARAITHSKVEGGVRGQIMKINRQFGANVIESVSGPDGPRHRLVGALIERPPRQR